MHAKTGYCSSIFRMNEKHRLTVPSSAQLVPSTAKSTSCRTLFTNEQNLPLGIHTNIKIRVQLRIRSSPAAGNESIEARQPPPPCNSSSVFTRCFDFGAKNLLACGPLLQLNAVCKSAAYACVEDNNFAVTKAAVWTQAEYSPVLAEEAVFALTTAADRHRLTRVVTLAFATTLVTMMESNGAHVNGTSHQSPAVCAKPALAAPPESKKRCLWFEEELEEDLRWVFGVSKILHTGVSEFQDIELVESGPFGKVLILDGKLQSAEADEFVYHESIVHPAMLYHPNPKNVFIMGGGEGSTAREALRHRNVEQVVMCDIDEEVVNFCRKHLTMNAEAFCSNRLNLVINCARAELEKRTEQFDIIIGDLADPVAGGPCYQLYTKSFYEIILKPRLKEGGILVTQGGPAGILSHTEVYSSIYNTLRQTFKYVVPYAAHVPSYADTWGWIMASDQPIPSISAEETDTRVKQRLDGELKFLDGQTLSATMALNKHVRKSLAMERHVYTEETARFIHGHGTALKN